MTTCYRQVSEHGWARLRRSEKKDLNREIRYDSVENVEQRDDDGTGGEGLTQKSTSTVL